ncbi:MAG: hypothetical protein EAZ13_01100 [Sphingobacteriia bacterium]|nr:MAG: hypothetical protein EAZ35_00575 [Sphingobacteriia bacterium]TAH09369.1 MAG: hypothetical protein EAZ13_01100 [Sphingobacteriia bacterium]
MNYEKKELLPTLYPLNLDTCRNWFIQYRDVNGRILKKYGDLNKIESVSDRLKEAKKMIDDIIRPQEVR